MSSDEHRAEPQSSPQLPRGTFSLVLQGPARLRLERKRTPFVLLHSFPLVLTRASRAAPGHPPRDPS